MIKKTNYEFFQKVLLNKDSNKQNTKAEVENSELNLKNNSSKSLDYELSSTEALSNYNIANINMKSNKLQDLPNGVSKFYYGGAKYTIYKHKDRFDSEFVAPKGFDKEDFFKHFDDLNPENIAPEDVEESENTTNSKSKTNTSDATIEDVNGVIDGTVLQGDTGDCWLLSALNSMSSTEKGREIIANSIKVNDDNTVTVTFNGLGISYTITSDEISKYDTDNNTSDSYSNGDNDALVMELAVEKLWNDINKGKINIDSDNEDITYIARDIDEGGLPIQLTYYLTGIESEEYYNDDLSDLDKNTVYSILANAYKNKNTTIEFGIYYNEHNATLIDGSTYSLDVGSGGHALAVTDVTSNTVTFVNPWDSSVSYTMSWEEFASLGIGYISTTDLTNAITAENVVDMTDDSENYDNEDNFPSYDYGYNYNFDYDDRNYRKYDYNYGFDYGYDSYGNNNDIVIPDDNSYGNYGEYNDVPPEPDDINNYNNGNNYYSEVYNMLYDFLNSLEQLIKEFLNKFSF